MPVSFPAHAALAPSAREAAFTSTQASHLAAVGIVLPGGTANDVQADGEFGDLWLRFVSSLAQLHPAAPDHGGLGKWDGPTLNGAGQDVSIEDLRVHSSGLEVDGDPPKP
jgi:hypothetical protein